MLDYQEESDVSQDFFFFFLNRSLDLAAHFKQDLVLRPVSVKGAMGGASRFLQSTILFDWGFQSGFIVAGVAKKSNWNLFFCFVFFRVTTPNNAGQNCYRDVRADRNDARLQEIVPAGRQDLVENLKRTNVNTRVSLFYVQLTLTL